MRTVALAIVLAITLNVSAAAQKQIAPNQNVGNPNERICETITPVGSRLSTKRFCGTRAEWAEKKREEREALEAAQRSPCQRLAGC